MFGDKLEYGLKVVGSVAALGGLLLAGAQFTRNQSVEAAKPYLEKKLKWCEEAVETAAFIATSDAGAAAALGASHPAAGPQRRRPSPIMVFMSSTRLTTRCTNS
jgi:hypothetical protein